MFHFLITGRWNISFICHCVPTRRDMMEHEEKDLGGACNAVDGIMQHNRHV